MLATRVWNIRNYLYPLKVQIARHREAFNELVRDSYKIYYALPNKTSRVRYLLTSFHTNEPTIYSANTIIQADAAKINYFEYKADFLLVPTPAQKHQGPSNHKI